MEDVTIKITEVYVPVKRRQSLNPQTVEEIAEGILQTGKQPPITVRWDGKRFILVTGLHRLEACKALGEETISATVVGRARQF
jgi:ParB-like chromosome segregation protein Spo0J